MLRYIMFIFMIALGAILGWFYTSEINPVNVVDAPPDTLREDYQTDYVLMVAEVYSREQNPSLAARQLALLGSAPRLRSSTELYFLRSITNTHLRTYSSCAT